MEKLKAIPVNEIKGIRQTMIEHLQNMGIFSVYDLLMYFPYRYENYEVVNIQLVNNNEKVTVVGQIVTEPVIQFYQRNKSRLSFTMVVDNLNIKVIAFNRHFLKGKIGKGMYVTVTGKYEKVRMQITANELQLKKLDSDRIEPVYSLKELKRNAFLGLIQKAIEQFEGYFNDDLPLAILEQYRLIDTKSLMHFVHFPVNNEQVRQVERRVKYEELLKFELKMYYMKFRNKKENQIEGKVFNDEAVNQFISQLAFELTGDQRRVVSDILKDLRAEYPMNRLLQGDVGSGKTIVSGIGLYANYLAGYQGAVMAPTEILAMQHFHTFVQLFEQLGLRIELLTSSNTNKEKQNIYKMLSDGEIDIIVGTHALIVEHVNLKRLGFVIIDEQHRFGVNQRKLLRDKGMTPDALFLSATPIPRTLSLTVFGDMDVSIIKEMPKGRLPIKTYLIRSNLEDRLIGFIDQACMRGEQVYIIAPLIEESEKIDLENAMDLYLKFQGIFQERYEVGLLHGKMGNDEKEDIMDAFKSNVIQILVSTTVVEVGVDVPNATLMVIIDADRFGLSQLHQLRGRVGRGNKQSYCVLVSDNDSDKTVERLEIMTKSNDGFVIAEEDLRLRGPGDFFGSRQSGLPQFKMADIIADYKILEVARNDAVMLIETNELFTNPNYFPLKQFIEQEIIDSNEYFD
jgi:ATP-dependent DNA helicase RecG